MVDGVVLAEEFAGAPSVIDGLAGYDKWRCPLARVQRTAAMLQRLCGIEQATTQRVRDAQLAGLAQFPRLSDEGVRGPWPPKFELSERHPCSAMPAEPTIARAGHSGRCRSLVANI
jgi:hypothetical protein